jgi:hypothetical protein
LVTKKHGKLKFFWGPGKTSEGSEEGIIGAEGAQEREKRPFEASRAKSGKKF